MITSVPGPPNLSSYKRFALIVRTYVDSLAWVAHVIFHSLRFEISGRNLHFIQICSDIEISHVNETTCVHASKKIVQDPILLLWNLQLHRQRCSRLDHFDSVKKMELLSNFHAEK
jgi:hypothetical protein